MWKGGREGGREEEKGKKIPTQLTHLPSNRHVLVHSTVTNAFTRKWLDGMRRKCRGQDEEGEEEDEEEVAGEPIGELFGDWLEESSDEEGEGEEQEEEEEEEEGEEEELVVGKEGATTLKNKENDNSKESKSNKRTGERSNGEMDFETVSFFEPHKMFQNSFSVFQKRGKGYGEPVLTQYP